MLRRVIKFCVVAGFVIAALLGAMWARSGVRGDYVTWGSGDTMYALRSDWGYLAVARVYSKELPQGVHWEVNRGGYAGSTYGPDTYRFYSGLIAIRTGQYDALYNFRDSAFYPTGTYSHISMSYALPITLLIVPAILWMSLSLHRRHKIQRRRMLGQCVDCGYDLRASSGACPECGASISTEPIST